MRPSKICLEVDAEEFFEGLFLSDDWMLTELPLALGDWKLERVKPIPQSKDIYRATYRNSGAEGPRRLCVDLDGSSVHQIGHYRVALD